MRSALFRSAGVGVVMGALAVFAACREAPTQTADPPLAQPEASTTQVMAAAAQELSPGVRAAMTRSLTAALAEFELESAASMRLLHDFLDGVESHKVERVGAAAGPAHNIDP